MSETETVNPKPNKGARRAPALEARKGVVIVDYDGYVGRATANGGAFSSYTNQRAVPHKLSPYMLFWPENGTPDLQLQPGVNLVPAATWDLYTKTVNDGEGHPALMAKIAKGYIAELSSLPRGAREVLNLIDRSIDIKGLAWILEQEEAGQQRDEVLDAVRTRLAKARPVELRPIAYQGATRNVRGADAPQPSLAMG